MLSIWKRAYLLQSHSFDSLKLRLSSTMTSAAAPVDLSTAAACAAAAAGATRTSWIAVNSERPHSEIRKLVQRRVAERNEWKVEGVSHGPLVPTPHDIWQLMRKMLAFKPPSQAELDEHFPVLPMDWEKIQSPSSDEIQITWLGHSGLLVQMNGCNILTDPVFSERCSPSQWFGPKRYRPPPCTIREICEKLEVDLVLISHNHYDHLDHATVLEICRQSPLTQFVVPLGLQQWFRKNVSQRVPIYEQDWHESTAYSRTDGDSATTEASSSLISVTSVPMRHWSNRTGDRDETLWCGYSVTDGHRKFLFPGDTAWFDGLEDLAKRHGPWDVAAIPIGAYAPREFMEYNHLNVEEAVGMKDAVQAKAAVPIHWGTFPLTTEPVMEPREKLVELMVGRPDSATFVPWLIGETKQF
jgi:N-acyl-phosphatidylethanolamine-hydrolysing phospholipase D